MTSPAESGRPRWLWICAEILEQLTTGLLVYSDGLSRAVARAGVDVTVVGIGEPQATRPDVEMRIVPGELQGGWRSVFSTLPNLSYACDVPELRQLITKLLDQGDWDAVVIDHLQVAWAVDLIPDDLPLVFVTHNHEASMRHGVAAELPLTSAKAVARRAAMHLDAVKAARLEAKTLKRADVVTSITESDQELFRADAPDAVHVLVKPGWSGTVPADPTPMAERPRKVGILGSFEWHVKQENLLRFATEAGPLLAEAGIEVLVAGSVPEPFRSELEAASPQVRCHGFVDSIAEFLDQCRLGVVAEPLGGGFKLKTLDYVGNRVPIAATENSVNGLPLRNGTSILEARDEQALGRLITEVIDDPARLELVGNAALTACEGQLFWTEQSTTLTKAVIGFPR